MKLCTKCLIEKELDAFGNSAKGKDGKRSQCKSCESNYQKAFYTANPERVRAIKEKYRKANPEKVALKQRKWAKKNPDKVKRFTTEWRRKHADTVKETYSKWCAKNKEQLSVKKAQWLSKNLHLHAAAESRRRAARRRNQPPWIKNYAEEMKAFFAECRRQGLTADHIIPLQGKTVSGLHVPWNMQMLSLSENSRKGNKLLEKIAT